MTIITALDPTLEQRPGSTAYSISLNTDWDRNIYAYPSASYEAGSLAGVVQELAAIGTTATYADMAYAEYQFDYETGVERRTFTVRFAGAIYQTGDGVYQAISPSWDQNTSHLASGITADKVANPQWEMESLLPAITRLTALFPTYFQNVLYPLAGEVAPPEPTAFWTQFALAREVI